MRPTFAGFVVAKRGLDAARANLNITGQNISNVNTKGYTRQRVDLYSVSPSGNSMRYASTIGTGIGEGVDIGGINQLRDPYLDLRYRREHAKVGNTSTQLDALSDIEYVFDEISKDGIDAQFKDMFSQLQNLASNANDPVSEGILKTSALMLTKMLNHSAEQISTVKNQELEYLQDNSIKTVNELLGNLAHINGEIKSAQVAGDPALELLDSRNSMLDDLAGYIDIEVTSKKVDVGGGRNVDVISINMLGNNNEKFNLVSDNKNRTLEVAKDATGSPTQPVEILLKNSDGTYAVGSDKGTLGIPGGNITEQFSAGAIAGHLKMLNANGEFDTPPTTIRGIGYYQKTLDNLAQKFSSLFNEANSTATEDKPMFAAADGTATITAGNISLSSQWQNSTGSYITNTKLDSAINADSSTASDNILYMISLFSKEVEFTSPSGTPIFKGNFQDNFTNISSTLALEMKDVSRQNDSFTSIILDIDNQRASISGVSIDEEGINLIQYNQSLSAASRFMTTLDEALNTIISSMGIVGR